MNELVTVGGTIAVAILALVGSFATASRLPMTDRRLTNAALALEKVKCVDSKAEDLAELVNTLAKQVLVDVKNIRWRRRRVTWLYVLTVWAALGAYFAFVFDWPALVDMMSDGPVGTGWYFWPRVVALGVFCLAMIGSATVIGSLTVGRSDDA